MAGEMMKRKGYLITVGVVAGMSSVVALVILVCGVSSYREGMRDHWKADAISNIRSLASDTNWMATEIAGLTTNPSKDDGSGDGWISDHLILMTDGSWMVYDNICTKSDWRIDDIFVGRASDGKWYYSTFHFCIGAVVLRFQGRPADLGTFVKDYCLSEFTGRATERLGTTWPETKRSR